MPVGIIANLLLQYKYFIMVPLVLFMQPAVGISGGILSRLGLMDPLAVYLTVCLTALAGDVGWYWIGYHYGQRFVGRFGRFVGITSEHVRVAQKIFHQNIAKILIISKVTNGFGLAIVTLFTAGMSRVPFGRYMLFNVIGEVIWSGMIVGIGYYLGDLYVRVEDVFGRFALGVMLVLIALLLYRAIRYVNTHLAAYAEHE